MDEKKNTEVQNNFKRGTKGKNSVVVLIFLAVLGTIAFLVLSGKSGNYLGDKGVFSNKSLKQESVSGDGPSDSRTLEISIVEVNFHNQEKDCWMIIGNSVYNLTDYINLHPGGKTILEGCGKDATELFETRPMGSQTPHSQKAREFLKKYYLGEVSK